jgi:hypothetical protein
MDRTLRAWLTVWASYPGSRLFALLVLGPLAVKLVSRPAPHTPLLVAMLGGPGVVGSGSAIVLGPGWTWFLMNVFFVAALSETLVINRDWVLLITCRGTSPVRWALAQLAGRTVVAVMVLAAVTSLCALAVGSGWRARPLFGGTGYGELGLWLLVLVCLGWVSLALATLTGSSAVGFGVTVLLIAVARFVGPVAPYVPFAQSLAHLHNRPGTLSVAAGAAYVLAWMAAAAGVVVGGARPMADRPVAL